MPYFIYLVKCSDNSFYCGCTNDLEKRVHQHNHSMKGARYTKTRRPVTLFYFEKVKTLSEALKRECKIKSFSHDVKSKLPKTNYATIKRPAKRLN